MFFTSEKRKIKIIAVKTKSIIFSTIIKNGAIIFGKIFEKTDNNSLLIYFVVILKTENAIFKIINIIPIIISIINAIGYIIIQYIA